MISRVAEHGFWLGRYLERTESTARLLATTHTLALDAELEPAACWRPVIVVAGEEAAFTARFGGDAAVSDGERIEEFLTWDDAAGVSLRRSVNAARWNARSIREVVSLDAWEVINRLYLWLGEDATRAEFASRRFEFYQRVRSEIQLVLGLLHSTMLHDDSLDFIWLGVMLERVSQTARILDVHHHAFTAGPQHEVVSTSLWLSLLRSLSGFEPFLKRHQGRVSSDAVVRFLIAEERFPRSILYGVRAAYRCLCALRPPTATHLPGGRSVERLRLLEERVRAHAAGLHAGDDVHQLLTTVVDEIHAVCDCIDVELFGHGPNATPSSAE